MIWAIGSYQSCFLLTAQRFYIFHCKEYNQADLSIDHWWCPSVGSSLVLLQEGVCYDQCVLLAKLMSLCPASFCIQGQTCLLLQVSLDFLLLHCSPLWWQEHLFWVLVLEGLIDLHRSVQLLQHYRLGHRLGLPWYWMVCLRNRDHSVVFEIAPKYCISESCWLWWLLHFF